MDSKKINNTWFYKNRVILLGVLIVILTHLLSMFINKSGFFGEALYVGGDNQGQLLGYVAEFKRKLINGESVLYTWNSLGGINFYMLFVTCLTNIYVLIMSAFPYSMFNLVCDSIIILNSTLMFISMSYYLTNRLSGLKVEKSSVELLIFGVPYALLPSVSEMSMFSPFLLAFVTMPLVILGLERIVYGRGCKLYLLSLSFMMISNAYMGLIGCTFIILYYFALEFRSLKAFVKTSVKVLLISLLGVLASAFYIVPQLLLSNSGGYGFSEFDGAGIYVNWLKIFDTAMWGSPLESIGGATGLNWQCNLYCGIVMIILTLNYFFVRRINVNIRVRKLIVMIILLLSINGKMCNYVIHLLHYTHGIPNRQTTFIMFYIIITAYDSYTYMREKLKKKDKIVFLGISLCLCMLMIASGVYNSIDKTSSYVVSVLLVLIYATIIIVKKGVLSNNAGVLLAIFVMSEVMVNYVCVYKLNDANLYSKEWSVEIESVVSKVDTTDGARCSYNEGTRVDNIGMVYGFNTNRGFSSICSLGYCSELAKLGVDASDISINERGYNSFLNAIFARKYIIEDERQDSENGLEYMKTRDAVFRENTVDQNDCIGLYENKEYVNPIIVAQNDTDNYSSFSCDNEIGRRDIAEVNNQLCYALTGVKEIITNEEVNLSIPRKTPNLDARVNGNKITITKTNETMDKKNSEQYVFMLSFEAPCDGEYVLCEFAPYNIGYLKAGDIYETFVRVPNYEFDDDGVATCDIVLNRLDVDKWKKAYNILKDNQMNIKKFEAGYIRGEVVSDGNHEVFTSIPYDSAWVVKVDGNVVTNRKIGEGFLSFDISDGEHDVEMSYKPKGVALGVFVSGFSFLLMVTVIMMSSEKRGR